MTARLFLVALGELFKAAERDIHAERDPERRLTRIERRARTIEELKRTLAASNTRMGTLLGGHSR